MSHKVAIFCPHCHRHTALSPAPVDIGRGESADAIWEQSYDNVWWIGVCNYCNEPVLVLNDGLRIYPTPIPKPTDKRVPDTIGKDLDEAKSCMQVDAFCAAAVMARRIIQQVAIDKGCTKEKLIDQINELATKGIITADVKEWATVVRWVGNDAAHPNAIKVEEDDAADIIDLASQLLQIVYVAPAIAKERRTKRGK